MKLLLDSHVLLWTLYEPRRLAVRAATALADSSNDLYISLATVWELSNKASGLRLPMVGPSIKNMLERTDRLSVTYLPITREDILATERLPHHHADPFDRIIVAQAIANGLTLLTTDRLIALYDVLTLWR